ncbi:MAG: hypothetical protein M3Q89_07040 [Verrucomicrobiota bacterium]|nr:hypothetical protein [Verrucomicrobiota bacterium]
MKTEMRRALALQSFEEKIRKVGQLIQLASAMKAQRVSGVDEHTVRGAYRAGARRRSSE